MRCPRAPANDETCIAHWSSAFTRLACSTFDSSVLVVRKFSSAAHYCACNCLADIERQRRWWSEFQSKTVDLPRSSSQSWCWWVRRQENVRQPRSTSREAEQSRQPAARFHATNEKRFANWHISTVWCDLAKLILLMTSFNFFQQPRRLSVKLIWSWIARFCCGSLF